ncbi:MAG TPA: hypothetical protein VGR25_06860 [bacterium]|jgi:hypothetical protein|nr:hypothetical protein [bacterium]
MSKWIMIVTAAALALAAGSSRVGAGASPALPPSLRAGAEWVYRHTVTEDGQTKSGTSTMTYRGLATYRGTSHHLVEYSLTLVPGAVERQFLVWDRGYFRQAAAVLTDGAVTLEIVFDRPIALGGVQETRSGGAQIYENGALKGTALWKTAVVNRGTARITVPAGTFSTTRWEGTYTLGELRQEFTVYMVGAHEMRAEIDVFVGGSLTKRDRLDLMRGPLEVR